MLIDPCITSSVVYNVQDNISLKVTLVFICIIKKTPKLLYFGVCLSNGITFVKIRVTPDHAIYYILKTCFKLYYKNNDTKLMYFGVCLSNSIIFVKIRVPNYKMAADLLKRGIVHD